MHALFEHTIFRPAVHGHTVLLATKSVLRLTLEFNATVLKFAYTCRVYSKCTILGCAHGAHGLFVSAGKVHCTTVGVYSGVTCNNIYELPQLVGAR